MIPQVPLPLKINTGMSTLEASAALQDEDELRQFIDLMRDKGVKSYLEIGVRYGGTFEAVCNALPLEKAVAVDFPGGQFGDENSVTYLLAAAARLRRTGLDIHVVLGPSSAAEVIRKVKALGPFDAILIDGDHSYWAVEKDFYNYKPVARKLIALHDIAALPGTTDKKGSLIEVRQLWMQMKDRYQTTEIVSPGSIMGIGVIHL